MDLKSIAELAQTSRPDLLAQRSRTSAELPLKYWNQQAHFTTPASGSPEKAIQGLSAVSKILKRFDLTPQLIASHTGAPENILDDIIHQENRHSPFVMVDAEDAVALTEESIPQAREGAIRCFTQEDWGTTLPFFRPGGLLLQSCVDDLITVLTGVWDASEPGEYPIAGIVWPKSEHPEELIWVCNLLKEIESHVGLPENSIKLEFLVESGYALAQLTDLVKATAHRLAGIIWGIADYAADTNLPRIENNHPLCDWARYEIVNLAGAVNVPAIDNMTLNYPTPLHRGSDLTDQQTEENRIGILDALKECYDDANHGIESGMSGKWVGHPMQLLMVMTAYRNAIPADQIEKDVSEIEAYTQVVESGAGATILGTGVDEYMADRATDRHLRARLRKATAWGALDKEKSKSLGIISSEEYAQL
jgi:citrate lyase beta subunit